VDSAVLAIELDGDGAEEPDRCRLDRPALENEENIASVDGQSQTRRLAACALIDLLAQPRSLFVPKIVSSCLRVSCVLLLLLPLQCYVLLLFLLRVLCSCVGGEGALGAWQRQARRG